MLVQCMESQMPPRTHLQCIRDVEIPASHSGCTFPCEDYADLQGVEHLAVQICPYLCASSQEGSHCSCEKNLASHFIRGSRYLVICCQKLCSKSRIVVQPARAPNAAQFEVSRISILESLYSTPPHNRDFYDGRRDVLRVPAHLGSFP